MEHFQYLLVHMRYLRKMYDSKIWGLLLSMNNIVLELHREQNYGQKIVFLPTYL